MERRLLIAFLLSTLLILGYQIFFYAPGVKKAEEQQRAQLEAERLESPESARLETPPAEVQQPADEPQTTSLPGDTTRAGTGSIEGFPTALRPAPQISVTTPHYRATLSTRGAEIVSFVLFDYETAGEPVELIAEDNRGVGGVALVGDQRTLPLGGVQFEAYHLAGSERLVAGSNIQLDEGSKDKTIMFRTTGPQGERIERYYSFSPNSYVIRTGTRYASNQLPFARRLTWSVGPGMTATEENEKDDHDAFKTIVRLGDEVHKKKRDDFSEDFSGVVQYASVQTKYFTVILLPQAPTSGAVHVEGVKEDNYMSTSMTMPAPERAGAVDEAIDMYIGPLDYDVLKAMDRGLEKNIDIGFDHFKIFKPVSLAVLWSLLALYKVIPNYGWVIIILSLFTKILFYRLTHKSFKSMRDMQALQPKLQSIKEKYKDDKQKLSQETMKLYKEGGVNPLGGCLPMLFQMPVFLALFSVLRSTIEVRRAPWLGWIDDLSQQDVLFTFPFSLPLIGDAFSVLPILMGVGMFMQSKIGGSITGGSTTPGQPAMMMYMLPVVFTFLFYKMPSGLVLYWLVNTVMSVVQQYYINKGATRDEANAKANEPDPPKKPPKNPKRRPRKVNP